MRKSTIFLGAVAVFVAFFVGVLIGIDQGFDTGYKYAYIEMSHCLKHGLKDKLNFTIKGLNFKFKPCGKRLKYEEE